MKDIFIKQDDCSEKRFEKGEFFYEELVKCGFDMDDVFDTISGNFKIYHNIIYIEDSRDKSFVLYIDDKTLKLYKIGNIKNNNYSLIFYDSVEYVLYEKDVIDKIEVEINVNDSKAYIPFKESTLYSKIKEIFTKEEIERIYPAIKSNRHEPNTIIAYESDILYDGNTKRVYNCTGYIYVLMLNYNVLTNLIIPIVGGKLVKPFKHEAIVKAI